MTVRELLDELQKLPSDVQVCVAESPGHDYFLLEIVMPLLHTDDDYLLLAGGFEE